VAHGVLLCWSGVGGLADHTGKQHSCVVVLREGAACVAGGKAVCCSAAAAPLRSCTAPRNSANTKICSARMAMPRPERAVAIPPARVACASHAQHMMWQCMQTALPPWQQAHSSGLPAADAARVAGVQVRQMTKTNVRGRMRQSELQERGGDEGGGWRWRLEWLPAVLAVPVARAIRLLRCARLQGAPQCLHL
jgi:hypothetical protein